jgi:7-carboxy-7-deazaguanine synthase
MFGLNPIRKVDATSDSLLVHSLFPTMQGEGPYAGQRAIFLRLGGCSLACSWCDTEFEDGSQRIPNKNIFELLEDERMGLKSPLCVITGGEPMRQNLEPLARLLLSAGWRVQIETAGIHWVAGLEAFEHEMLALDSQETLTIVCSPKTPKLNPILERYCMNYKFIINAAEPAADDGLPLYAVSQAHKPQNALMFRPKEGSTIFVQPLDLPNDPDATQKNIERCTALVIKYGYRLSLQLHKILGLP